MSTTETKTIEELTNKEYKYGFVTDIEADTLPKGLNEDVIKLISAKKNEPEWMTNWRLKAFRHWQKMECLIAYSTLIIPAESFGLFEDFRFQGL